MRSAEDANLADLSGGHGGMLLVRAGAINGGVWRSFAGSDETVLDHPGFDLLAADVCQHGAIDLNARGEGLAALLLHFPAEGGILDDVLLFVGQLVLAEDGADAFAPAAEGFEISGDLGGFSRGAHGESKVRAKHTVGGGKCKWEGLGLGDEGEEAGLKALGQHTLQIGDAAVVTFGEHLALVVGEGDEVHAVERNGHLEADNAVDE